MILVWDLDNFTALIFWDLSAIFDTIDQGFQPVGREHQLIQRQHEDLWKQASKSLAIH